MVLNMTHNPAWLSGFTARWHAGPYAAWLAHTGDTVAAHSGRMAAMCAYLWPDASAALYRAIACHDAGEAYSGDVPHGVKQERPDLAKAHFIAETDHAWRIGLHHGTDATDTARLRFLDRFDAHEWVKLKAPALLALPDWRDATAWLEQEAERLGIADRVHVR